MNHKYQHSLYSDIFNEFNDDQFYKAIFTTIINEEDLVEVLTSNAEDILSSSIDSDRKLKTFQIIYQTGLDVFCDAIKYPESTGSDAPLSPEQQAQPVIASASSDDDGNDLAELGVKLPLNNSSTQIVSPDDDGDDLSTLSGAGAHSRNQSTSSGLGNVDSGSGSASAEDLTSARDFDQLNDESRVELIINTLKVFDVLFDCLVKSSNSIKKASRSVVSINKTNLIAMLFSNWDLNKSGLTDLLIRLKWYMESCIEEIEQSDESNFVFLSALKESIYFLTQTVRSFYLSIHTQNLSSSDEEFNTIKELLYTFHEVDFSGVMESLMRITSPTEIILDDDSIKYFPPKVRLSAETLITLYLFLGAMTNTPKGVLPDRVIGSDITNTSITSINPYKKISRFSKEYDWKQFNEELNMKFLPIFCMEFNYCYQFRPDLMAVERNSILSWLTFQTDLYSDCDTLSLVANSSNKHLSLLEEGTDFFLKDLQRIYELKMTQLEKKGVHEDRDFDLSKLLPVMLNLYTLTQNSSFLNILTKQKYEYYKDIEARTEEEMKYLEMLEIFLCLSSYIFEYQYRSPVTQTLTKIILFSLMNITTSQVNNLKTFQINEYKWKLCHQKLPYIPLDIGKKGYKSSLFYILDCVQNLLRFNLTNRLNLVNFRLGLNLTYKILTEFQQDPAIKLGRYNWDSFNNSLFGLIKFLKKPDILNSKHLNQEVLKCLVEECLLIVDLLLDKRFSLVVQMTEEEIGSSIFGSSERFSINYSLVYNILLNFEAIQQLIDKFRLADTSRLSYCMNHFNKKFHLSRQESQTEEENKAPVVLEFDFDSPQFVKEITKFISESSKIQRSPTGEYMNTKTFEYLSSQTIEDKEMIEILQNALLIRI
ncbi:uncharacterized protein J8A68_003855 [[Candida] subhashii]|uniref:Armadillo-like helical domain-containing protein n=1 Tax=[Candida] subhashii TaxID=561895 RepID=A0A8J5QLP6_9ASCO|nr:uncharacterized protein J8A68_003855 [[Candida] subhashii]KAG7662647.1 hypothetical protein J8A68_003855 [[Candida] subhashii]